MNFFEAIDDKDFTDSLLCELYGLPRGWCNRFRYRGRLFIRYKDWPKFISVDKYACFDWTLSGLEVQVCKLDREIMNVYGFEEKRGFLILYILVNGVNSTGKCFARWLRRSIEGSILPLGIRLDKVIVRSI